MYTKDEAESFSDIVGFMEPYAKAFIKNPANIKKLERILGEFAEKNANVLIKDNIVGRQLLFNQKTQDDITTLINLDMKAFELFLKGGARYYQWLGGNLARNKALLFALPLMFISREYAIAKKDAQARFVWQTTLFRPYASMVSKFFPHGINEDRMMYTIETISDKYLFRKFRNIMEVITHRANSSFDLYMDKLIKEPTDKLFYDAYVSGIESGLSNPMKNLARVYYDNENKFLSYENNTFEGTGDSEGETFDSDIRSDSAIRDSAVKRVMSRISKYPVDEKFLEFAVIKGFTPDKINVETLDVPKNRRYYNTYGAVVREAINNIINNRLQDLPIFFESLIASYMFEKDEQTGARHSAADLRSVKFVYAAVRILTKSPNTRNKNMRVVRDMMQEFLDENSDYYKSVGETSKGNFKKAMYYYFVLLVAKG